MAQVSARSKATVSTKFNAILNNFSEDISYEDRENFLKNIKEFLEAGRQPETLKQSYDIVIKSIKNFNETHKQYDLILGNDSIILNNTKKRVHNIIEFEDSDSQPKSFIRRVKSKLLPGKDAEKDKNKYIQSLESFNPNNDESNEGAASNNDEESNQVVEGDQGDAEDRNEAAETIEEEGPDGVEESKGEDQNEAAETIEEGYEDKLIRIGQKLFKKRMIDTYEKIKKKYSSITDKHNEKAKEMVSDFVDFEKSATKEFSNFFDRDNYKYLKTTAVVDFVHAYRANLNEESMNIINGFDSADIEGPNEVFNPNLQRQIAALNEEIQVATEFREGVPRPQSVLSPEEQALVDALDASYELRENSQDGIDPDIDLSVQPAQRAQPVQDNSMEQHIPHQHQQPPPQQQQQPPPQQQQQPPPQQQQQPPPQQQQPPPQQQPQKLPQNQQPQTREEFFFGYNEGRMLPDPVKRDNMPAELRELLVPDVTILGVGTVSKTYPALHIDACRYYFNHNDYGTLNSLYVGGTPNKLSERGKELLANSKTSELTKASAVILQTYGRSLKISSLVFPKTSSIINAFYEHAELSQLVIAYNRYVRTCDSFYNKHDKAVESASGGGPSIGRDFDTRLKVLMGSSSVSGHTTLGSLKDKSVPTFDGLDEKQKQSIAEFKDKRGFGSFDKKAVGEDTGRVHGSSVGVHLNVPSLKRSNDQSMYGNLSTLNSRFSNSISNVDALKSALSNQNKRLKSINFVL